MNIQVNKTINNFKKKQSNSTVLDNMNDTSSTLDVLHNKININKRNQGFIRKYGVYLIIFILIASISSLGLIYTLSKNKITDNSNNSPLSSSSDSSSSLSPIETSTIPTTPPIVYIPSPVNGVLISSDKFSQLQKHKVLGVMIENLGGPVGARPQSGLQDADIVYESEAEGDITRFMGIFWNNKADIPSADINATVKLQPIRSARKAYLDWLLEYNDPLYMHIGQAESTNPQANAAGALINYNIKDLTNNFSRDQTCQQTRAQEHCAYSDTQRLWTAADKEGWNTLGTLPSLVYKDENAVDPDSSNVTPALNAKVSFESDFATYSVNWKYDPTTNTYLRFDGNNKPFMDAVSGKQVFTKTLLIQKTTITVNNDEKFHKLIKTVGSGDVWILQDGKQTLGTWKKDTIKGRTRYYDKTTNQELALDRGKMWITVTGKIPIIS